MNARDWCASALHEERIAQALWNLEDPAPAEVRTTLNGLGHADERIHGLKRSGASTRFFLEDRFPRGTGGPPADLPRHWPTAPSACLSCWNSSANVRLDQGVGIREHGHVRGEAVHHRVDLRSHERTSRALFYDLEVTSCSPRRS
ncbi:hypothetical protein [Streptomyces sp. NPDC058751]|uniref:hypothetical protein n=1 Tax=Streptomyces sp. NPDC058751 TaxID=3346623 RepID=UPI0036977AE6